MMLGAISFALHFRVGRAKNVYFYWRDEETRTFIVLALILSVLIAILLLNTNHYDNPLLALNEATFHLISFITSTGYGVDLHLKVTRDLHVNLTRCSGRIMA